MTPKLTRSQLLRSLDEWGAYVHAFQQLPPDRQAAFLGQQGFDTLQDLLGHIVGWWEEGRRIVDGVRGDQSFAYSEPPTDAFNAELVRKIHARQASEVLEQFEATRRGMLALVESLTEGELVTPLIRDWLAADVIEHLDEHRLPD